MQFNLLVLMLCLNILPLTISLIEGNKQWDDTLACYVMGPVAKNCPHYHKMNKEKDYEFEYGVCFYWLATVLEVTVLSDPAWVLTVLWTDISLPAFMLELLQGLDELLKRHMES